MTHSPPFLEKVYNGRLVRCLRVKSFLTYFYVGSGTFALDAYYSTHSPPFLEKVYNGRLVRCLRVKKFPHLLLCRLHFSCCIKRPNLYKINWWRCRVPPPGPTYLFYTASGAIVGYPTLPIYLIFYFFQAYSLFVTL